MQRVCVSFCLSADGLLCCYSVQYVSYIIWSHSHLLRYCLVAGYPDFLHHRVQTSSLWELCLPTVGSGGWVDHCFGLHHLDSCVCRSHIVGAPWFISTGEICLISVFTPLPSKTLRNWHHALLLKCLQKSNSCNNVSYRNWSCPSHLVHWVKKQRQRTMSEGGILEV